MKIEFHENEYGSWFDLKPETTEEMAMLMRTINNSLAEKPEMKMWFSKEPSASFYFKKVKPVAQRNYLSNKKQ